MRAVYFLMLLPFLSSPASGAETITAVCREPVGRTIGVGGVLLDKSRPVDESDGMKGGMFTIVWKTGEDRAQIVSQGSGGTPLPETGIRILENKEQVSFLVVYPSAVWLYSLFSGPKVLLITSHNNGYANDVGGALNKSFKAPCEISKK